MPNKNTRKQKQGAESRRQKELARIDKASVSHLNAKCPVEGCGRPFVYKEGEPPMCDECFKLFRKFTWFLSQMEKQAAAQSGRLVIPGSKDFQDIAKQISGIKR